jgi:hypothetical protein
MISMALPESEDVKGEERIGWNHRAPILLKQRNLESASITTMYEDTIERSRH